MQSDSTESYILSWKQTSYVKPVVQNVARLFKKTETNPVIFLQFFPQCSISKCHMTATCLSLCCQLWVVMSLKLFSFIQGGVRWQHPAQRLQCHVSGLPRGREDIREHDIVCVILRAAAALLWLPGPGCPQPHFTAPAWLLQWDKTVQCRCQVFTQPLAPSKRRASAAWLLLPESLRSSPRIRHYRGHQAALSIN